MINIRENVCDYCAACITVCPVDCIYTYTGDDKEKFPNQLYIHPEDCIDCAACEPVCPVAAIFPEDTVPEQWNSYTQLNYDYFKDKDLSTLKRSN